ncbi:hypothetical protein AAFF_G00353810 [Aldrovandia affinis]|uniref:Uncharacterized protein n=1 Tax=Aldrovandia affinis TaxID=143900 RepID=A0AAD7R5J3_9TELE|nr:hypothetical protein AAFF_G00353810 [Aldrovandia affinis]
MPRRGCGGDCFSWLDLDRTGEHGNDLGVAFIPAFTNSFILGVKRGGDSRSGEEEKQKEEMKLHLVAVQASRSPLHHEHGLTGWRMVLADVAHRVVWLPFRPGGGGWRMVMAGRGTPSPSHLKVVLEELPGWLRGRRR